MESRITPVNSLKQCSTDIFLKNILSSDSEIFNAIELQILNDPLYIGAFFEKLKESYEEKKTNGRQYYRFF